MSAMPENIIAVNIGSYGKYRDGAFAHLEKIGIRNLEIPAPAPDQVDAVRERLREHGLRATSLLCPCDLAEDPESMRERLEAGRAMEVPIFFISAKAGDLPKPEAYARLRARGALADEYGITLSLETHPDLGENATEARATMPPSGTRAWAGTWTRRTFTTTTRTSTRWSRRSAGGG